MSNDQDPVVGMLSADLIHELCDFFPRYGLQRDTQDLRNMLPRLESALFVTSVNHLDVGIPQYVGPRLCTLMS